MKPDIIKIYKKSLTGKIEMKLDIARMGRKGYCVAVQEDERKYSGLKGCLLFLLFPPLAFFGFSNRVKITYRYNSL